MSVPVEAFEFQQHRNREDHAALAIENHALRAQLEANGIEPITRSRGEWLELHRAFTHLAVAASEVLALLGTSRELLDEKWRR
jgi:hypothetical protein